MAAANIKIPAVVVGQEQRIIMMAITWQRNLGVSTTDEKARNNKVFYKKTIDK